MVKNQSVYLRPSVKSLIGSFGLIIFLAFAACSESNENSDLQTGIESSLEIQNDHLAQEGWETLFDGETLNGWRGLGREDIPQGHWIVEDGAIRKVASSDVARAEDGQPISGGDLLYDRQFSNFELSFEWKVSTAANSGIKYNVSEEMSVSHSPRHAALGFEYQVLDDAAHPDAANDPNRWAAGLYDLIPPSSDAELNAVGEWNTGRIVFNGNRGEHWLNGKKILEYELGTLMMDRLLATSKWGELGDDTHIPGFGDRRSSGYIVLQDHGDDVWYRNIMIREL
ncbi:MAG: DUF1080 domain-containing protein [Balneolaceae bacterium]|nr:MAG: DUF1080 domain-containing protein [Balneolaceae bacterium]